MMIQRNITVTIPFILNCGETQYDAVFDGDAGFAAYSALKTGNDIRAAGEIDGYTEEGDLLFIPFHAIEFAIIEEENVEVTDPEDANCPEDGRRTVLYDGYPEFTDQGNGTYDAEVHVYFTIVPGDTYFVTIDGQEHELVAFYDDNNQNAYIGEFDTDGFTIFGVDQYEFTDIQVSSDVYASAPEHITIEKE